MQSIRNNNLRSMVAFLLIFPTAGFAASRAKTAPLPDGTAIPIVFTHTINARREKQGDKVTAKTMQVIFYGSSQSIAKGSLVVGHVVGASYTGKDQPSAVTIQFDRIVAKQNAISICVAARAMANTIDAYNASMESTSLDTSPSMGTTLIGGDHVRPGSKQVYAIDGDDVGISNRFGIFSRLEPGEPHGNSTPAACSGVSTLQSVAIFSSRACGLYGFPDIHMSLTGNTTPHGEIELQSDHNEVEIHAGSAALLQVIDCTNSQ